MMKKINIKFQKGYQTIVIESPCFLSLNNNCLVAKLKTNKEVIYPLHEVNLVILNHLQITITSGLMNELLKMGIVTLLFDNKHQFNGTLLSHHHHTKLLNHWKIQIGWKQESMQALWTFIVTSKISNQMQTLNIVTGELHNEFLDLMISIKDNDITNVEAQAAKRYFKLLFGPSFKRFDKDIINGNLNYGYAILQSLIQQAIVRLGYFPHYGIHHHSQRNRNNLAYDLMEPFRPIVDRCLFAFDFQEALHKSYLQLLHQIPISYGKTKSDLATIIPIYVNDCLTALKKNEIKEIPEIRY